MPPGQRPSSVKAVWRAYPLRGAEADAVADAYDVISAGSAPLIVLTAARMLPDLKADADAGRRIMTAGQGGHALAAALRGLDPAFFEAHCSEVVLSGALAELALQDLERPPAVGGAGEQFPRLAGYRQARTTVAARHVPGSYRHLTDYLQRSGVPAGVPGAAVTVVSNGLKGTIQELLAAMFPRNGFHGRYVAYLAPPGDPHPGSKQGYLIHQDGPGWTGLPLPVLPADPALTFACRDAVKVLEDTLQGTRTSPAAWAGSRPRQRPQREMRHQLAGLNPALVDRAYTGGPVREAVRAVALLAIYDRAAATARARHAGQDWQAPLAAATAQFTADVRAWISGQPTRDPRLRVLLDSFVRRADQDINQSLARAFGRGHVSPDDAMPVWKALAGLPTLPRKQQFASMVEARLARGGLDFSVSPAMTRVPRRGQPSPRTGYRAAASLPRRPRPNR